MITILAVAVSILMSVGPISAQQHMGHRPLKVIAPDLIVETAEYGAFVSNGNATKFTPTTKISRNGLGEYGWRLRLKTTRKAVYWSETGDNAPKLVRVYKARPVNGYIEHHLDWVSGIKGKFAITVNVENVPVKTFTITAQ